MSEKLLWSVKNGDIEAVKQQIREEKPNINAEINSGRNALHFAADYGQTDVIQCLVEAGADVNQADKHGITPLLAAIWENHIEAVKLLLNKQADKHGITPLLAAIWEMQCKSYSHFRQKIIKGANKNGTSPDGSSYKDCAETDDMKMLLQ